MLQSASLYALSCSSFGTIPLLQQRKERLLSIPPFTGGRREIVIICPACEFRSTVPPAALARNSYYCSRCGKAVDLLTQQYRPDSNGEGGAYSGVRRDKNTSRYKSARKGRR